MNITILSIDIKTIPNAKGTGSYQTADVAYKNNSFQGKVEGKKIMSFGATKASFEALATAAPGTTWEVSIVKNDKGYNDWVSMTPAGAANPVDQTSAAVNSFAGKSNPAPKSNYETSEERAQRQVLIVRQSSVSAAVNALTPGAKSPLKAKDIVSLAKELEGYVFGKETFEDVPDFDPAAFPVAE